MSTTTKTALKMAEVAIDGLEVIQAMTKIGGDKAAAALQAIDKVVSTLRDGLDGVASPQTVVLELDALRAQLLSNDAAADAALRARFGK